MPTSILGNVFNSAYGMLNPFVTKPPFSTTTLPSPGSRLKTLLREPSATHLVIPSKTTRGQVEPVEVSRSFTNPLYRLSKLPLVKKTSFQFVEYTIFSDLRSGADKIKLLFIDSPPYSTAHRVIVATFLDEFAKYLEPIILSPEPLVITGDMNIHVDDPNDPNAIKFLDLLDTYGLTQHVNSHTHRLGHTLDLIITRVSDSLAKSTPISDSYLSDHSTVLCPLVLRKPVLAVKQVTFPKIKDIDLANFKNNIAESCLGQDPPVELKDLVSSNNISCASILNKHALMNKCVPSSSKQQREITAFTVLMRT